MRIEEENFLNKIYDLLTKEGDTITHEEWIHIVSILVINLEYRANINYFMDCLPADVRQMMKDNLT
jgi:hypothetical protein